MNRTAVNPWAWSLKLGYNQAEIIEGATRQLLCAGQTSVDESGAVMYAGDMRGQIELALDNLDAVLKAAGMNFAHLVRVNIYATDMDEALRHFDLLSRRFGLAGVSPPMTLLGVTRLALHQLMIEIEATAAK